MARMRFSAWRSTRKKDHHRDTAARRNPCLFSPVSEYPHFPNDGKCGPSPILNYTLIYRAIGRSGRGALTTLHHVKGTAQAARERGTR